MLDITLFFTRVSPTAGCSVYFTHKHKLKDICSFSNRPVFSFAYYKCEFKDTLTCSCSNKHMWCYNTHTNMTFTIQCFHLLPVHTRAAPPISNTCAYSYTPSHMHNYEHLHTSGHLTHTHPLLTQL